MSRLKFVIVMKKNKFDGLEGMSFGITGGVITILGVLIGLAATGNKIFTELGIIVVGIADALSDAAAMYVSEESEYVHTKKQIHKTAFFTFLGKIITLVILIIPLLVLDLYNAVIASMIIGLSMIGVLAYFIADGDKKLEVGQLIIKYILIAIAVAIVSYFVGYFANMYIQ